MRNAFLFSAAVLFAACATGGEEKRGELVSAQQKALAQQERDSSEQRPAMDQTVQGRVVEVQGNEIQIWTPQNQDVTLDLSESVVRVNGQPSTAARIKPGNDVRASCKVVDGKAKALQIDVTSRPQ